MEDIKKSQIEISQLKSTITKNVIDRPDSKMYEKNMWTWRWNNRNYSVWTTQEKKAEQNQQSLWNWWDYNKKFNTYLIGFPEWKEKEDRAKKKSWKK